MAQHGYLHDQYDGDGFSRGSDDDRERSSRDRDDHRRWGDGDRDHDRGSMFGWRDEDRHLGDRDWRDRHGGNDRGFFERTGDEVSSWTDGLDDDSRRGSSWSDRPGSSSNRWSGREQGRQGDEGRRYSAHPDDHYRSWRDKQMQALDRDYQDYCREREQQFHSEFDSWRQNRRNQRQSQQGSSAETMELDNPVEQSGYVAGATSSPTGAATLGTNNSENAQPGTTDMSGRER